ncbi:MULTISPECIES: dihydrodipicolinate synthase family protein [Pseudonocardia]|uniref:L-2-keto-3-deoxyarabonate dehydratase n=2 Tax=Pseudonocardia TaxID=1847 RepID=A0A1Y2MXD6_PSEAH|nr:MULTISPECIES: dihydrodipicolinate synthase family protein [Pseudonocardia]OSY39832.1 L-2-keto-3-deoxyarabonate dehydratase [Pseudonocardia autotrophica]TDN74428.1 4-hydroxy-tetrahydrodipicolinate synthase [Pseudonocardia autotrophica]BBG05195.1 dihydrodipicolinate synthase family protein [Pseudonocardia autotrophica]GEC25797.1 dihydrodipicolinate synthase family protein [Pseudonocardia saturnea]
MTATRGLMPILATPFGPDGALDPDSLRRLVSFQLESGADGVAVSGMASEAFALTADERSTVTRTVVQTVNAAAGAVPVVCGVNATSTVTAVEQALAAEQDGATALMVLPPYMVKPSPQQIVEFYGEVAAATACEVMVQDAPGVTGVAMSPELIARLADLPGVTSVKVEAPPTAPKVAAVREAVADRDFAVLGGQNAQFCLDEYAGGAVGTMPACEFTDLLRPVLDDWTAGETARARDGFARLLPLIVFGLQPGPAWAVHKEVLVARGIIDDATVRAPARPLAPRARTGLREILAGLGAPQAG